MTPQALKAVENYKAAKLLGLTMTEEERRSKQIPHHPISVELFKFIQLLDAEEFRDFFDFRDGGEGDNGEVLMAQFDAYFELKDKQAVDEAPDAVS